MNTWLTIEVVTAALLVTSFTCVGLLALWAATSSRHWFLRTAIALATLAPLLLIPAYEPFAAFALQCCVVVSVAAIYRKTSPQRRFSLSTFLLAVVVIAVAVPIVIRMPELNAHGWLTIILNGVSAGLSTLVGAWWWIGRRNRLTWPIGVGICVVLGVLLSVFDWFFPSIVNFTGWPPDPSPGAAIFPGFGDTDRPIVTWLFLPALNSLMTWLLLLTLNAANLRLISRDSATLVTSTQREKYWHVVARIASIGCLVTLAAFPCYVLFKLLTPDPLPSAAPPTPNGYDDLIAAGNIAAATQFDGGGNFDYETATQTALAAEVAKCGPAYERLLIGLSRPCLAPVNYFSQELTTGEIQPLRALGRSVAGKGRLAEMQGRFDDAADAYIEAAKLGFISQRGGLLIDGMVGVAITTNFGAPGLYQIKDKLADEERRRCIDALAQLDSMGEPYHEIEYRDRVWSQRSYGWHGHLMLLLSDIVDYGWGIGALIGVGEYEHVFAKRQAEVRLLICELALARYRQDSHQWPGSLSELLPNYLPAIPFDPFDPSGQTLRYRLEDDTYVLYSLGANGVDDGGAAPTDDDYPNLPQTGDLRLDLHFAAEASTDTSDSADVTPDPKSDSQ